MSAEALEPPRERALRGIHVLLIAVGIAAFFAFSGFAFLWLPGRLGVPLPDTIFDLFDIMILPVSAILGVTVFGIWLGRLPWSAVGLRPAAPIAYLRAIGLWLLCLPLVGAILYATYEITGTAAIEQQMQMMPEIAEDDWLGMAVLVAFIALLAPAAEELIFRGVLFTWLRRHMGFWPSAVGSALVFSAAHGIPAVILPTAILGTLFAWIYEHTGSLKPAIAAHVLHNLVVTLVMMPVLLGGEMPLA